MHGLRWRYEAAGWNYASVVDFMTFPVMVLDCAPTLTHYKPHFDSVMTSEERREKRYQRRKAAREAKRRAAVGKYDNFERLASISALIVAHWEAQRGVMWKASPVRYDSRYLKNAVKIHRMLMQGKDIRQGFFNFSIVERGKRRNVHSLHYMERVIRRSVCINGLVPLLSRGLIYDNGASLKGKGVSFAVQRTVKHLQDHYKKYGTEGYALVIDFKSFFNYIVHSKLFEEIDLRITDERIRWLARLFITATGESGLYIGPEDSQIFAIAYPNRIDHIIKDVWRLLGYERYMDDSHILHQSKADLLKIRDKLFELYAENGIVANPKKTQVVKLTRGFTYLKIKFILCENGHVVCKPCRQSIVRERRKLKSFARFEAKGILTPKQTNEQYLSWRGAILKKDAYRSVKSLDARFYKLFNRKPWEPLPTKMSYEEWLCKTY